MLTKQVAIILPLRVAGSLGCYKTAQFIAPKVQIFTSENKFICHRSFVRKFMQQLSVFFFFTLSDKNMKDDTKLMLSKFTRVVNEI